MFMLCVFWPISISVCVICPFFAVVLHSEMIGVRSFLTHFQSVRRRSRPMTSQPRLFILASICPRGVFLLLASGVLEDMVCLSRRPEVPR